MIAWFDLESTGLPPLDKVHILEVAVVQTHPHTQVVRTEYCDLVKPPNGIPEAASQVNGIYDKDVADKPKFAEIAKFVHGLLHNNIWAGHNIRRFDVPLLLEEFKRCGMEPPTCLGTIDTLDFANRHFAGRPGLARTRLETLARYFDLIPPKGKQTHRALDDVHLNIRVAQRMFAQIFVETALLGPQMTPVKTSAPGKTAGKAHAAQPPPPSEPGASPDGEHKLTTPATEDRCTATTLKDTQCRKRICRDGQSLSLCHIHLKQHMNTHPETSANTGVTDVSNNNTA